ncbi:MAG: protease modulator HflC [Betaproteobacteria bacterium]|nr:protease modulator HflC [Betaproteobacteria bacterium]
MRDRLPMIAGTLFLLLLAFASMSMFVVDQREYAIVFQFGEVKQPIDSPGLKFKLPLIQDVRRFERRILTMDSAKMDTSRSEERFLTSEKQNVIVDYFVKWRIEDPVLYFKSVSGDTARAEERLNRAINAGLRLEFGRHTVAEVISAKRDAIMQQVSTRANRDAETIGVKIVDVRLKRVEYPSEVSSNVYSRMEAERKRIANERRSKGKAESEKIRADADRERDITVANATREALQIQGEGDARAAAIYAEAYNADPEFYSFYRSLEAYRASFAGKEDLVVIAPDSDFFKYLKAPQGRR